LFALLLVIFTRGRLEKRHCSSPDDGHA